MGCGPSSSGPEGEAAPTVGRINLLRSPPRHGQRVTELQDELTSIEPLRFVKTVAQHDAELLQLDDVLADSFSAGYFLRYTQSEFSSENVAFLLAARRLQKLKADDPKALKMSQQIIKDHILVGSALEVNMPPSHAKPLMAWFKSSLAGKEV